jgi:signal transduction histidine kinase
MLNSKPSKMVWGLKTLVVLLILYDILIHTHTPAGMKAVFVTGILLMQANDLCRVKYRLAEHHRALYTVSMIVNIAAIGIYMVMFDSVAASVYYVFPIAEVFLASRTLPLGIVAFHAFVYLAGVYATKTNVENSLLSYLGMLLLVYLFRGIGLERQKSQLLNAELVEAHAKLKETAIVKERTRIAQEMHDSIGHSLIALRMHLEFAENMIDSNPQKVKDTLSKAHHFSQKSIQELRKAVAVLKDQSVTSAIGLEELLTDMIESLETSGKLKFTLQFDKKVESCSLDMKNCIYNSVREAVTNGLKHGKAEQFLIDITKAGDTIRIVVEDDGVGCSHIKKSNGLQGIENRIDLMNGKVLFSSEKGHGFKLMAEIPA